MSQGEKDTIGFVVTFTVQLDEATVFFLEVKRRMSTSGHIASMLTPKCGCGFSQLYDASLSGMDGVSAFES